MVTAPEYRHVPTGTLAVLAQRLGTVSGVAVDLFYVHEHNRVLPHSAFRAQTPDEMYFGTAVPANLRSRAAA